MPIPEWIFQGTVPLIPPEPKINTNLSADEKQRRQTLINAAKPKWDAYLAHYNNKRPGPAHTGVTNWTAPPSAGPEPPSAGPEPPSAGPEPPSAGPPPGSGSSAPSSESGAGPEPPTASSPQAAGKLKGQPPDPVKLLSCSEIKARCGELNLKPDDDGKYKKCYHKVVRNVSPFGFSADKEAFDTRDGYKYAYIHPDKAPLIPPEYVSKYYPNPSGNYEDGFQFVQNCVGADSDYGKKQATKECDAVKAKGEKDGFDPESADFYQKCIIDYPEKYNN